MSKLNPNAPVFIPSMTSKDIDAQEEKYYEADRAWEAKHQDELEDAAYAYSKAKEVKAHTYWEPNDMEDTPSAHRELPVEVQQAQCDSLNNLKKSRIFRRRLTAFLEKEYCLDGIDVEKGCRIELDIRGVFNENYVLTGKKKKHIGFWFNYKQDGIIYGVVYECDVIDDPKTGWFFQNICDDECGGTCSLHECATAYQRE